MTTIKEIFEEIDKSLPKAKNGKAKCRKCGRIFPIDKMSVDYIANDQIPVYICDKCRKLTDDSQPSPKYTGYEPTGVEWEENDWVVTPDQDEDWYD